MGANISRRIMMLIFFGHRVVFLIPFKNIKKFGDIEITKGLIERFRDFPPVSF